MKPQTLSINLAQAGQQLAIKLGGKAVSKPKKKPAAPAKLRKGRK